MEKREAEMLKQDLGKFLEATTTTVASFRERIDLLTAQKTQSRNDGIVLDYKTFAEVVNVLSINPELQDLYNKVVAIGSKQFEVPKPEMKQQPVTQTVVTKSEDEVNSTPKVELPPFIQALIEAGIARVNEGKECDCPICRTARGNKFSGHTDEEIEAEIQKQFPGAKLVKDPAEMLALLKMLADMERRNGRGSQF